MFVLPRTWDIFATRSNLPLKLKEVQNSTIKCDIYTPISLINRYMSMDICFLFLSNILHINIHLSQIILCTSVFFFLDNSKRN